MFCLLKAIIHLLRTGIFKDQSQHLVVETLLEHEVMIQQGELLPRKVFWLQNCLKCQFNALRLFIPVAQHISIDQTATSKGSQVLGSSSMVN